MSAKVTVVCLCYNHEKFVREALDSVVNQTYANIEIIVVDDFSRDGSRELLKEYIVAHPDIVCLFNSENSGNCTSFNRALRQAKGEYIIDFATDDVMHPERIEKQVSFFDRNPSDYAAVFTNAIYINENGEELKNHYLGSDIVPSGDVYANIIKRNSFICTPTLMFRIASLREVGGYDETLSYEDFDICLRLSRRYKFGYLDEVLTRRRIVQGSHGRTALISKNKSTYKICQKAYWLNKSKEENTALAQFLRFNLRLCLFTNDYEMFKRYYCFLKEVAGLSWFDRLMNGLCSLKINLFPLYQKYVQLRFGYVISLH